MPKALVDPPSVEPLANRLAVTWITNISGGFAPSSMGKILKAGPDVDRLAVGDVIWFAENSAFTVHDKRDNDCLIVPLEAVLCKVSDWDEE